MLLRAEKGGAKMPDRDQNRNAHEGLRLAARPHKSAAAYVT